MDRRFSACGGNGQASQVGMDSEFQLDLDVSPMFCEQIHEQSFSTPPHVLMRSGDQIEPPNCEDIQEIDGDQFANGTGILATREVSHNEEKHSCLQRTGL